MSRFTLRRHIQVMLMLSIVTYLMVSFVKWNILWFIEIPDYTSADRAGMVFLWGIFNVIAVFINCGLELFNA